MLSRFFIDRPVFAWVIAIMLMLVGTVAVWSLPVRQYPNIAPPMVSISATYPGASAQTLQDTVVQVIEQQLTGIDRLDYITSESNADYTATVTLTFTQGTNPDTAQVQVQNKLQLAIPLLPQEVQQQGLRVNKPARNYLAVLSFYSEDGRMSGEQLADYAATNLMDPLNRTAGVGEVQLIGAQYSMRIWLDPAKLDAFRLTPADVVAAVRAQNVQVSAGQLGGLPAEPGQAINANVIGPTRLTNAADFREILLRVNPDGSQVRVKDVARVAFNAETYTREAKYNDKPSSGLTIRLAAGGNALDTMDAVRATIDRLTPFFPPGFKVIYSVDTAPFIRASIKEVVKTLVEAIVLVFLVMYLFLQNFRATLIPTIAVPVVLLGTFGVLAAFGFSINTLTMFGLALAIGLLVDDAIVVVENVERLMAERGLSPREATRLSMDQISGALIGIALVLGAVFVPMAFFGGTAGVIYRQFSITLVSAMALSVLAALILTPALCATLLKPVAPGAHHQRRGFFGWFNRGFARGLEKYESTVRSMVARTGRSLLVYGAMLAVLAVLFLRIPTSFMPNEDSGFVFAMVQAPPGASRERTWLALDAVRDHLLKEEKDTVESVFTVAGFNFGGTGQTAGNVFVKLKDWSVRPRPEQGAHALAHRMNARFASFKEARVLAAAPPAAMELGNTTGFDMQLQNRVGLGHEDFLAVRDRILADARANPALVDVRNNGLEDAPQLKLDIDREKASAYGVSIADINQTLATAWASTYVNDFVDHGRVKRVYVQGEPGARMQPQDLDRWYVRNAHGDMVPFSAFATGKWTLGPQKLVRFNGVPAFELQGSPAPGHSSGEAMRIMEDLVSKASTGVGLEWTGLSFEERLAGAQAPALYALSILVVFLCLAALYESWAIPATVLMVVPLGMVGTVLATLARDFSNDVYFQVGLLTAIGLSAKSAVLIVEFAKANFDNGMGLLDSVLQAARQRIRPIVMTSFAFIFGVLPLALSRGAGSGAQNAIGTGVIGGTLTAAFLAIFFVPVFFVAILGYFKVRPRTARPTASPNAGELAGPDPAPSAS